MTQWYVKDLSKLTAVSAQTLHHYDRIGLMKPSIRLANGYRLYSEKDLLKLQQIIALKFFGFELKKINLLLSGNLETLELFAAQAKFLEEKANNLLDASKTLQRVISESSDDKSVSLKNIIELIEVYRMTKQIENTWAAKVLTPEELREYAQFEDGLKTRFTPEGKKAFENSWAALVKQVEEHLNQDPNSDLGKNIGKQLMDLVCNLYGKEHAELRHSIWEKGFKAGKTDGKHALDPKIVEWMDKAIDNYYRERITSILAMAEMGDLKAEKLWNEIMEKMCGNSEKLRLSIYNSVMDDDKTSQLVKKWLKEISSV